MAVNTRNDFSSTRCPRGTAQISRRRRKIFPSAYHNDKLFKRIVLNAECACYSNGTICAFTSPSDRTEGFKSLSENQWMNFDGMQEPKASRCETFKRSEATVGAASGELLTSRNPCTGHVIFGCPAGRAARAFFDEAPVSCTRSACSHRPLKRYEELGCDCPVDAMNLRENENKAGANVSRTRTSYTPRNVDSEIEHLERVLAGEGAHSMFGRTYWRARVMEVRATPGLVPRQLTRLERLLSRFIDDGR